MLLNLTSNIYFSLGVGGGGMFFIDVSVTGDLLRYCQKFS